MIGDGFNPYDIMKLYLICCSVIHIWITKQFMLLCFMCGAGYVYIYINSCIRVTYFVVVQSLRFALLFCDPLDCSPPGSSVHGILQARKLEWVAISSSRGSF